jgi:quinol-cytochrome oxidoreductase complex cytochrome b subunit
MSFREKIRNGQLWRSIFRRPPPTDRRNRVVVVLSNFVLHLHPLAVPRHAVRPSYTWCMGGITLFLFLVETITGVLLMFYYRPTLEWAYNDVLALRDAVSFGVLRELHRWGAHAMVIAVWLHMLRVFLTGSYKPPREFNWVIGVALLVLTLLLSFTGYPLPGDQLSIWAITVGANMAGSIPFLGSDGLTQPLLLGARTVSEETLNRFYVLHCIAIPLAAGFLMALHFWRVRKDGDISGPL